MTPSPSSSDSSPRVSRARRRRERRTIVPKTDKGRAALLNDLVRRSDPTYELFLFALLSGAILGAGYLFDSEAVLLLGILLAPLMTPWAGMTLASASGSARFFFRTFAAILIAGVIVFGAGAAAGVAAHFWTPPSLTQTLLHSRLWWADLAALAFGAALLMVSFVRSEKRPTLPSVMVAYEFFLPISAAGFGLTSGAPGIFPQGVFVFVVHIFWATLFGMLVLFLLGFRPLTFTGIFVTFLLLIGFISALFILMKPEAAAPIPATPAPIHSPSETPSPEATSAAAYSVTPRPSPSSTPRIATSTPSPTRTPTETRTPTVTPTSTMTPEPTPVYARIAAERGGGAYLRREPEGLVILTLANGDIVEILPDTVEKNGTLWIHVLARRGNDTYEGWMIQEVLETATPSPSW